MPLGVIKQMLPKSLMVGFSHFFFPISIQDHQRQGSTATEDYSWTVWLFVLAQLFHGAGAAPLFTLGVTYIDENVSKKMSSIYLGKEGRGRGLVLEATQQVLNSWLINFSLTRNNPNLSCSLLPIT